jgi:hypothetical protein
MRRTALRADVATGAVRGCCSEARGDAAAGSCRDVAAGKFMGKRRWEKDRAGWRLGMTQSGLGRRGERTGWFWFAFFSTNPPDRFLIGVAVVDS